MMDDGLKVGCMMVFPSRQGPGGVRRQALKVKTFSREGGRNIWTPSSFSVTMTNPTVISVEITVGLVIVAIIKLSHSSTTSTII